MSDKDKEEHYTAPFTEVAEHDDAQATEQQTVRKSERVRTLTEKGKEFQEEKVKSLQHKYALVFEKWRYEARLSKVMLRKEASVSDLKELIDNVKLTCKEVQIVYDQIRQIQPPEADVRRKVDACTSLSAFIINRAEKWLKGDIEDNEEPWPDLGSCLGSESSKSRSKSRRSKGSSGQSCSQTIKRMEAEAEAAASKEILAIMEEQENQTAELQKLERENLARQQAIAAENLERQQVMEEQRRKIERLE